jgi:Na+-translocating ferredoxin:NAD+ oxidoreductase subunit D
MPFIRASSPHSHSAATTPKIMGWVLLALVPGALAQVYFWGLGVISNLLITSLLALLAEALVLRLRGASAIRLRDGSALVTACLLALSLPPASPLWLMVVGTFFAIVLAKQLYGGLGYNPFNPAMVGYVVLLIAFPAPMTQWPLPIPLAPEGTLFNIDWLWDALLGKPWPDGLTGATALDLVKQRGALTLDELYAAEPRLAVGFMGPYAVEWVNLGYLAGGLFLLARGVMTWHTPVAFLAALAVMAAIFYDGGSSQSGGSPLFHGLSGATMLGAFFILTDPVSGATSRRGRLIFGAVAGILVYCIRHFGNYPDAVAFSVLLLNFAAPFIDYYTLPRTYGQPKPKRATHKERP